MIGIYFLLYIYYLSNYASIIPFKSIKIWRSKQKRDEKREKLMMMMVMVMVMNERRKDDDEMSKNE